MLYVRLRPLVHLLFTVHETIPRSVKDCDRCFYTRLHLCSFLLGQRAIDISVSLVMANTESNLPFSSSPKRSNKRISTHNLFASKYEAPTQTHRLNPSMSSHGLEGGFESHPSSTAYKRGSHCWLPSTDTSSGNLLPDLLRLSKHCLRLLRQHAYVASCPEPACGVEPMRLRERSVRI